MSIGGLTIMAHKHTAYMRMSGFGGIYIYLDLICKDWQPVHDVPCHFPTFSQDVLHPSWFQPF